MVNHLKRSFVALSFCMPFVSFAQEGVQNIQQKFIQFNSTHPQEKLFVHTDKSFYLVGELVWLKLYDDKQDQLSKVAYVDIVDAKGKTVLNAKISLKENDCNGSLLLPLSLNTGNYILRAYTNWMKNTVGMSFFEKTISVVNPFKNPDTTVQHYTEGHEINFFPEGGNLVKGLASKVGFKVVDKFGKGVEAKGYLVNDRNEQVASFETFKFGIGSFSFTPTEKNYRAIITFRNGMTAEKLIPVINDNGYVMSVSGANDMVHVKVQTSYTGPQSILLYVQNRQIFRASENLLINNGVGELDIPKNKLGKGVVQFTIFNANKLPVCERLYFIKPQQQTTVVTSANNKEFGSRKKVQVSVAAKNSNGVAIPANMSLAVYPADSVQDLNTAAPDIESYLWLSSDVKGSIEHPSYYFTSDPQSEAAADNLMLTQGWRRFTWNDILNNTNTSFDYLPEYSGHFIIVEVTDTRTNKPATAKELFFSVPGKPFEFVTAVTNEKGLATFNVKELFGLKKIIVQVNAADKSYYKIDLLNPFYSAIQTEAARFYLAQQASLLEQYSVNMQVQNIYNADSMRMFYVHEAADSLPFFGKTSHNYNLDDYTRFQTMEEVLREYVREINVVARNGNHYLKILDEPRQEYNEEGILVLWDGVPLQDPHTIFKFNPLKAKRLEIIPRRYAAGDVLYKGVASFTTYNADLAGFTIDSNMLAVDYEGLQLQREFYSPVYQNAEQSNSRMPDFRNTLYWSPNINTTAKGETKISFYTADRKGNYIGVLQGLDKDGNPLVTSFTFTVK